MSGSPEIDTAFLKFKGQVEGKNLLRSDQIIVFFVVCLFVFVFLLFSLETFGAQVGIEISNQLI